MNFLLSIAIFLILFSCGGQERKPHELEDPRIYTSADIVTSSLQDSNGDLWFGTSTEGLYKYDGTSFTNFDSSSGLCSDQIWSVYQDDKGLIWMATNRGLCSYDGQSFTHISLPVIDTSSDWFIDVYPTINPNQAVSITQDKNGLFWIGTSGTGAYRYDGNKFESVLAENGMIYEDGLHHNVVQCILEDGDSNIWLGSMSRGGVTRYDGSGYTEYGIAEGLSDDMIRCLYQDNKGNIWIGTNGNANGGLDRFDGQSFTHFKESDGLCSNNVAVVYQSSDGKIWIGSDRGGLCYFEDNAFTTVEKLADVAIRTVIEDRKGNLWFGGRRGNLWKYDGQEWTDWTQSRNK